MSDKVLIDRKLLERLQERLDPHRDAVDWGMVCNAFRAHPAPAEQVEVVCITQGGCNVTWTATKELTPAGTALMSVRQHQRILAATMPADQVEDDRTMVKVSRELLQDLRDLAFDQVEHHRAAMGAYKQTRQSAMDSVLAQADALLRS